MRGLIFPFFARGICVWLIFSLSGCAKVAEQAASPASPSPSQDGWSQELSPFEKSFRARLGRVDKSGTELRELVSELLLLVRSNGTLSTGTVDGQVLSKRLDEAEAGLRRWKLDAESLLEVEVEEFDDPSVELDRKLILIGQYFQLYSGIALARAYLKRENTAVWKEQFGLQVPFKIMAQLTGFLSVDKYGSSELLQVLLFGENHITDTSLSQILSSAPQELDMSGIVIEPDVVRRGGGIRQAFSFMDRNSVDRITLQMSDWALANISARGAATGVNLKTVTNLMKVMSVLALYERYGQNTRYMAIPSRKMPELPSALREEFPQLARIEQQTLETELKHFEYTQRQGLIDIFPVPKKKKPKPLAPRPLNLTPEAAAAAQRAGLLPAGWGSSTNNASTNNASTNKIGTKEPVTAPAPVSSEQKPAQTAADVVAQPVPQSPASVPAPAPAPVAPAVVAAPAEPAIQSLPTTEEGADAATNQPPAGEFTFDPSAILGSDPAPAVPATVPATGPAAAPAPATAAAPAPAPAGQTPATAAADAPAPAKAPEKDPVTASGLKLPIYVSDLFFTDLVRIVESSSNPIKDTFIQTAAAKMAQMRSEENAQLRGPLERNLLRWPLSFNSLDEAAWTHSLRTVFAKAKHDSLNSAFATMDIPEDIAQKVAKLRSDRAVEYAKEIPEAEMQAWLNRSKVLAGSSLWRKQRRDYGRQLIGEALELEALDKEPASEIGVDLTILNATLGPELARRGVREDTYNWIALLLKAPGFDAGRVMHEAVMNELLNELLKRQAFKSPIRYKDAGFVDHQGQSTIALRQALQASGLLTDPKKPPPLALPKSKADIRAQDTEALKAQVRHLQKIGEWFGYANLKVKGRNPTLAELPLSEKQQARYRGKAREKLLGRSILSMRKDQEDDDEPMLYVRILEEAREAAALGRVNPRKVPPPGQTIERVSEPDSAVDRVLDLVDPFVHTLQRNISEDIRKLAVAKTPTDVVRLIGESTLAHAMTMQFPSVASQQQYVVEEVLKQLRDPGVLREGYNGLMAPAQWMSLFVAAHLVSAVVGRFWQPVALIPRLVLRGMSAPWLRIAPYANPYLLVTVPFWISEIGLSTRDLFREKAMDEDLRSFFYTSSGKESFFEYTKLEASAERISKLKKHILLSLTVPLLIVGGAIAARSLQIGRLNSSFKSWVNDLERIGFRPNEYSLNVAKIEQQAQARIAAIESGSGGVRPQAVEAEIQAVRDARDRLITSFKHYEARFNTVVRELRNDKGLFGKQDHYRNLGIAAKEESLNPFEMEEIIFNATKRLEAARAANEPGLAAIEAEVRRTISSADKIRRVAMAEINAIDLPIQIDPGAARGGVAKLHREFIEQHFFWGWRTPVQLGSAPRIVPGEAVPQFAGKPDFYRMLELEAGPQTKTEDALAAIDRAVARLQAAKYRGDQEALRRLEQLEEAREVFSTPLKSEFYNVYWFRTFGGAK